jgi:hypothetical protein
MKEQLERRLSELKKELESGQKTLAELEAKQASVRETMLRISGAIQVIEEELSKEQQGTKAARASTAVEGGKSG